MIIDLYFLNAFPIFRNLVHIQWETLLIMQLIQIHIIVMEFSKLVDAKLINKALESLITFLLAINLNSIGYFPLFWK